MVQELPVYLRVGDGEAHQIGSITSPAEMDGLLREVAGVVKSELRRHANPPKERQEEQPPREREQPAPSRDRQVRPARDR